ncbi:DUF4276 family protein [Amycolatopsis sp. H20-H5]|uniref:DUF4276 family protein n=1 Tax=Amycolatopsis sp. H20-H5 TaxID=3046309 RepID=UPI002DB63B81|nr:DUF4276 family protein [Amycolatopsis sp. H20-H5]MEC3980999.1 DUF4276 family protein [Amycolatopsis sp. H20-H5]
MTEPISLEILVEERSAKQALDILLPRIVPAVPFEIREFQGKDMLVKELPRRFAGYAERMRWERLKVVVVVDRDDDDCKDLKRRLEGLAEKAGLSTTASVARQVLTRIVIEELESWFFGDVSALRQAYPRIPSSLGNQAKYRDPDGIGGGTWEALARLLAKHGYHKPGLAKLQLAKDVATHMDIENNRSQSFQVFRDGVRRLVSEES